MDLDPFPLFRDLDAGDGLAVAVSGGSDSLALLLLVRDFLARHRPSARLLAVTVDHGLRPGAAAEAARVAVLCHGLGVAHRTVCWRGAKPRTGLSAAAREARYGLLADAAQEFGAGAILTGHTLDDQAETLAMRAARGDGDGLAGMARATLFDGRVWIARPLLGARRQALRDMLRARGVGWIDDPTNEDPAYERARVRKGLGPGDAARLAAQALRQGAARQDLAARAAGLVARFANRPVPGLLRLDRGFLDRAGRDREAAVLAWRALLATAGGTPRLPDAKRTAALHDRLAGGGLLRATLSRAIVDARRGGVFVRREARGLPVLSLDRGTALWDGRWRVSADDRGTALSLGPAGHAGMWETPPDGVPPALLHAALAAEPGLFSAGAFVARVPGPAAAERGVSATPVAAPFARFLPGFDLALAAAVHRLVGAAPLPAPPWRGHNAPEA